MIEDLWAESSLAGALHDYKLQEATKVALEGRFGLLPERIRVAIEQADEATCYALLAHVTTDTLEQVETRLRVK